VENYRSSAQIIAAANALIAHNRERMKQDHPIRINRGREDLDPGGRRQHLDPLGRGRVQVIAVAEPLHQALALVDELRRLRQLDPGMDWSRCALLAREWSLLDPVRALCEAAGIPVCLALPSDQQPPPFRVREHRLLLDHLRSDECRSTDIESLLTWIDNQDGSDAPGSLSDLGLSYCGKTDSGRILRSISSNSDGYSPQSIEKSDSIPLSLVTNAQVRQAPSPWWEGLRELLHDWRRQSGAGPQPARLIEEQVCDVLAELRRSPRLGKGVFLSTVHSAKGMEFDHVLVPDGGWSRPSEDERRLYYVGITRARETLCLLRRADAANPFLRELAGDHLLERDAHRPHDPLPEEIGRKYAVLGLKDLDLGYAGRFPPRAPIHQALANARTGDRLAARQSGHRVLLTRSGVEIASLSRQACERWLPHLDRIAEMRVMAMIQRTHLDGPEAYRAGYKMQEWELPMVQVVKESGCDDPGKNS